MHVDSLRVLVTVMSMMILLYVPSFSMFEVKQIVRRWRKREGKSHACKDHRRWSCGRKKSTRSSPMTGMAFVRLASGRRT